MINRRTCTLIILDGWGIGEKNSRNAVHLANTNFLDQMSSKHPNTQLFCSGSFVGLPDGIMGNSEVGHLNIGAGRIVYQNLLRINNTIEDGSFYDNYILNEALGKAINTGASLHLIGLLSDGGVHSQISHLYALLDLAKKKKLNKVFIHPILDGRDTPIDKGVEYLKELKMYIDELECGSIASLCGRYYVMDRDQRWNRVKKAYELYTCGVGREEIDPIEAIKKAYLRGETDEFIEPISIKVDSEGKISDNDVVVFFNFRADRAREISHAFTNLEFKKFKRDPFPKLSSYITMTLYDEKLKVPNIFPPIKMVDSIGEVISSKGLKQLRIAETEKYAHVTYFFNGGDERKFLNEDRCLIPSPRDITTYDQKPSMSAWLVADETIRRINSNKYDFIVINFANMDMVGHTGSLDAAIKACETVDKCVEKIIKNLLKNDGIGIITSDHGNSEKMLDRDKNPFTAHTTNKVPFLIVSNHLKKKVLQQGSLCDIAPTILEIMGIEKPSLMSGKSLFL